MPTGGTILKYIQSSKLWVK